MQKAFFKVIVTILIVMVAQTGVLLYISLKSNNSPAYNDVAGAGNLMNLATDDVVAKHVTTTSGDTKTAMDVALTGYYSSSTSEISDQDLGTLVLDILGNLKVTLSTALNYAIDSITTREEGSNYHYIAAPAANEVVKATAGTLDAIVLGAWVTGGTVECSDHATDGDGNVKVFLTMGATDESGLPKTVPINAKFNTGITCDTIGATQVTILYK